MKVLKSIAISLIVLSFPITMLGLYVLVDVCNMSYVALFNVIGGSTLFIGVVFIIIVAVGVIKSIL